MLYPALYCLGLWWVATGAIVFLNNLPPATFARSFTGFSALAAAAFFGLAITSRLHTLAAVYAGFTAGVLLWGWHEMAFFMGFLTGPRQTACSPGCRGARHFGHGVQACIDHELAIVATAAGIFWVTLGAPNRIGLWTFCVLWGMRQSAKLNVFLGVRNLGEAFLPTHLRYLLSFMSRRRMNWLLPISVLGGVWIIVAMARLAASHGPDPVRQAGLAFLMTMMALAVLEHVLLVVPLPVTALWGWWLRRTPLSATPTAASAATPAPPGTNFNFGPALLASDRGAP